MVEFCHSACVSVVETTYLGILFMRSPKSPVSVMVGHAFAKPSYVTRPSNCTSEEKSSSRLYCIASSLKYSKLQCPGSSNTPSNVRYSVTISFLMFSSLYKSSVQAALPLAEIPATAIDSHRGQ